MNLRERRFISVFSRKKRKKGKVDAPLDAEEEGDTQSEERYDVPVTTGEPDHAQEGSEEGVEGPGHGFDEAGVGARFED
jgi:hypothetical protein